MSQSEVTGLSSGRKEEHEVASLAGLTKGGDFVADLMGKHWAGQDPHFLKPAPYLQQSRWLSTNYINAYMFISNRRGYM